MPVTEHNKRRSEQYLWVVEILVLKTASGQLAALMSQQIDYKELVCVIRLNQESIRKWECSSWISEPEVLVLLWMDGDQLEETVNVYISLYNEVYKYIQGYCQKKKYASLMNKAVPAFFCFFVLDLIRPEIHVLGWLTFYLCNWNVVIEKSVIKKAAYWIPWQQTSVHFVIWDQKKNFFFVTESELLLIWPGAKAAARPE